MVTELPVNIEFSLPDGWQAAPPDEVGAPEVAFVAVHPGGEADGFTANLTVAGEIRDPAMPIAAIAEDSVHRIGGVAESVRVRDRVDVGPDDSPGMTQVLDIVMGQGKQLVQCQVYLSLDDVHDPGRRAVLELALTCTREQLEDVLPDFQRFVGTIRPST
jgi:hypothetical protein